MAAKAKVKTEQQPHNYFASATVVKKGDKKGSNKAQKQTEGLLLYSSIDAVEKSLKTLKANLGETIKEGALEEFVKVGRALEKRPENYFGNDGAATASIQLKRSISEVSEMQAVALQEWGVETETVTEYSINPECQTPEVLEMLNQALGDFNKKNPGAGFPTNLFKVKQKVVATDASLDQAFRLSPDLAREVVGIVGTLAIKPKIEGEDFSTTVGRVAELLVAEIDRKTATVQ